MKMRIFCILLIIENLMHYVSLAETTSNLTCIPPDQTRQNITSMVNENTTLIVNGQPLSVAYCADVINWPISNETLYNWTHYDQGIFFFILRTILLNIDILNYYYALNF